VAKFVKGDVVVVPFPFSNLSQSKRRPALVIASIEGNDAKRQKRDVVHCIHNYDNRFYKIVGL